MLQRVMEETFTKKGKPCCWNSIQLLLSARKLGLIDVKERTSVLDSHTPEVTIQVACFLYSLDSLYITGTIAEKAYLMLLDTGTTKTILRPDMQK